MRAVAAIGADPGFARGCAGFLRDIVYGEAPDFETTIPHPAVRAVISSAASITVRVIGPAIGC